MFRKIFDWYMDQKMVYVLLVIYLTAATSATVLIPGGEGLIIWAWGTCNGCSEDLNDDGVVGLTDLMIVIDSWDMECL